ncbi:AI-2E family transporter [Halomonas sp. MCCC 1A17488]|uniref:AI-2E family transporter n=1 Tax=Billgrantia sulfidoxydans TaxID=2733484 RepID=A0ABX7W561_9GAMM|nr:MULTISPECIES: AI-2E family transporter [Halomonas]MCE8015383.1 AI-2E family transporter [Halomonas sp. MCCC 1A17488]MCG3238716.1 AI-2E family transporter [Halomonas sp. MCCC 1A17488]QPP51314.1 AI-2E family transporter [Halomonas sp. SS10-MC5]QTP54870.1 AI-2E family transporter [Halomonas sulfidoxydans]
MRREWWILGGVVAVVWLLFQLETMLMPFIAGMILAYLCDPLADRLERLGLSRMLAVCAVFLLMTILLAIALLILIPLLMQQIRQFNQMIPGIFAWVQTSLAPQLQDWTGLDVTADLDAIQQTLARNWQNAGEYAAQLLGRVGRSGMAFITWVTYVALIPVVTFYLLLDWDRMMANLRDMLPRHWEPDAVRLSRRCDEVLSAFLRGQLLVMLSLGVIYALGLTLVGVRFGLLIGMVAGLASIVPFLGFIVGISVALLVAFFQFGTWLALFGVVVVFAIGQALESTLLQPKLLGDRIGLHPVAVIFAVLAGGNLFGFTGVLLALPAAAVIMVLLRELNDRYKRSTLYDVDGPQHRHEDSP